MTHAPDDYAVVIGINDYPNWANGKKSLKGAVNDARAFHAWLVDPRGGGLLPDNARLVLSTENPVSPMQPAIDDALRIVRKSSDGGKTRRRFYFFFSGHGHSPFVSSDGQALCLANWSPIDEQGAALEMESYLKTSVGCLKFEEGIFFLDCCRVQEFAPLGKSSDLECGKPEYAGRHRATFYAAEQYTSGYENNADKPEDVHGFFTTALLGILRRGRIELKALDALLPPAVSDLAYPKNQTACSTLRVGQHEIFLGPPPLVPPPDADGVRPPGPRVQLSISLQTNLTTATSPEEPPAPHAGAISVHRDGAIVTAGRGELHASLSPGPYRIRIAHGEAAESHDIDLTRDAALQFKLPKRISAAPLSSTVDKHEFITDPIVSASHAPNISRKQSLFVAVRARAVGRQARLNGELRIRGFVGSFNGVVQSHTLVPVPDGTYQLTYHEAGAPELSISVPVAIGWDTQVFIVEDRGRPILERASVFMQRAGKGFDPADGLIDAYELALADLASGGPGPDRNVLDNLLYGKFHNPLFGLVGARFLLRDMERGDRPDGHVVLDEVIKNMDSLLGDDNPDVVALHMRRAQLKGEAWIGDIPLSPPLLQASFLTMIEATAGQPDLFDRQLDDIALGRNADSPWTCWREPMKGKIDLSYSIDHQADIIRHYVDMERGYRSNILESILRDEKFSIFKSEDAAFHRMEAQGRASTATLDFTTLWRLAVAPEWVVEAMRAEIAQSGRTGLPLDIRKLVRRLGLPRGLLEQAERVARHDTIWKKATPTSSNAPPQLFSGA